MVLRCVFPASGAGSLPAPGLCPLPLGRVAIDRPIRTRPVSPVCSSSARTGPALSPGPCAADRRAEQGLVSLAGVSPPPMRTAAPYPELHRALPVVERRAVISSPAIHATTQVVISPETGSSKTTQIPKDVPGTRSGRDRRIGLTQPAGSPRALGRRTDPAGTRRPARRARRLYIGSGSPTPPGLNGQGRDRRHPLNEMQRAAGICGPTTLIIDGAHEHSFSIDFILGYISNWLLPRRPTSRSSSASATIDPQPSPSMHTAGHWARSSGVRADVSGRDPLLALLR